VVEKGVGREGKGRECEIGERLRDGRANTNGDVFYRSAMPLPLDEGWFVASCIICIYMLF
jgi:hypothetical protein